MRTDSVGPRLSTGLQAWDLQDRAECAPRPAQAQRGSRRSGCVGRLGRWAKRASRQASGVRLAACWTGLDRRCSGHGCSRTPGTARLARRCIGPRAMVQPVGIDPGRQQVGRRRPGHTHPFGSSIRPIPLLELTATYSRFNSSNALDSNRACHSGASRQSLSSWAPPMFLSCSAVGA